MSPLRRKIGSLVGVNRDESYCMLEEDSIKEKKVKHSCSHSPTTSYYIR